VVQLRSCWVIYYFYTPALGRRYQSFGRVTSPYPVNIKPYNIKPYKSSFIQNGEIKKLVIEMLLNGIIQHSVNPFAPLALLVEKKITLGDFT